MNYSQLHPDKLAVLAKDDERALEFMLKKYKGLIISKVRRYYIAGSDFDDLVQEANWGFTKAVKDFDPKYGKSFVNFAMLCIGRQITTTLTTANRQKMQPLNESLRFEANVDSRTYLEDNFPYTWGEVIPSDINIEREVMNQFSTMAFTEEISEVMSALELKVCDLMAQGYKLSEIAEILGRTPKSIDNTMQRIKHKMVKYKEAKERGELYVPRQTGARCQRSPRPSDNSEKALEDGQLRFFH